jgi:Rrf2 family protein
MFSKACEYALRSSIFIAEQSMIGKKSSLKETAKAIDSPEAFTAKILQKLIHNQFLSSEKGPGGGFIMSPSILESLRVKDLVLIMDGDSIYRGCGLGLKDCNELEPCPLHDQFKSIRVELSKMLDLKITEMAHGLRSIPTFLKNEKISQ